MSAHLSEPQWRAENDDTAARALQVQRIREHRAAQREWDREHGRADSQTFVREILPLLRDLLAVLPLRNLEPLPFFGGESGPVAVVELGLAGPLGGRVTEVPNVGAIEMIAAHYESCSSWCSNTQTARS